VTAPNLNLALYELLQSMRDQTVPRTIGPSPKLVS